MRYKKITISGLTLSPVFAIEINDFDSQVIRLSAQLPVEKIFDLFIAHFQDYDLTWETDYTSAWIEAKRAYMAERSVALHRAKLTT